MNGFTLIPNELFEESHLSIPARFLFLLLLKFAFQKNSCFPSQEMLAQKMGMSVRHIRNLLNELEASKLISRKRSGFNKVNVYSLSRDYGNYTSSLYGKNENSNSSQMGTVAPFNKGTTFPNKNKQIKEKDKKGSMEGLEILRQKVNEIAPGRYS